MGGITKALGGLFGGQSAPSLPPAPSAPTGKDPAVQAAEDEERRKRANSGRASTLLTDPALGASAVGGARKLFTGQ